MSVAQIGELTYAQVLRLVGGPEIAQFFLATLIVGIDIRRMPLVQAYATSPHFCAISI